MPSGDGLIVRLRVRRARLSVEALRGLGAAARSSGNGIIELTRRGSLQIRGVSWATLASLQADVRRLGLAEPTPERERAPVLNVCPLAGLDARSALLEPLADALEPVLADSELTRGLAEKFLVVLSGGSDLFDELHADLRLELEASGRVRVRLGGTALRALDVGTCPSGEVAEVLRTLLRLLQEIPGEPRRLRDLVELQGAAGLRALLAHFDFECKTIAAGWRAAPLGFHTGLENWFGIELPFGSASAEDWTAIAEWAERFGRGEIRILPRRVLLPGVSENDRGCLSERARQRHFMVERALPALQLVACSGAPACRSARGETRRLAGELAGLVRETLSGDATLHVSGCEKGCAWSGAADITLVHGTDGVRLGFGMDVAETARQAPLSLDSVRAELSARWGAPGLQSRAPADHTVLA